VRRIDLSWLEHLPAHDPGELSREASAGLACARLLTQEATPGSPRTVEQVAWIYRSDPSTIRRWIRKARRELTQPRRPCVDCNRYLPRGARKSRRYCDEHASPAARVRRHRKTRTASKSEPMANSAAAPADARTRTAPTPAKRRQNGGNNR
jgi:hypothetical protein